MGGGLPYIHPGALPRLQTLSLDLPELAPSTLPASWGADPRVLPMLRTLSVHAPLAGPLPAAWAGGFKGLRQLSVVNTAAPGYLPAPNSNQPAAAHKPAAAPAPAAVPAGPRGLPPEWALGFSGLQSLQLSGLDLPGSLPAAWVEGGFPQLAIL